MIIQDKNRYILRYDICGFEGRIKVKNLSEEAAALAEDYPLYCNRSSCLKSCGGKYPMPQGFDKYSFMAGQIWTVLMPESLLTEEQKASRERAREILRLGLEKLEWEKRLS